MKQAIAGLLVGIGGVCCASGEAYAWSEATHAYIADHVGKKDALQNYNEIYGAMVPDTFNTNLQLLKDPQLAQCIRGYTHGYPLTNANQFEQLWDSAGRRWERNAAYGYVGHNDLWGADFTAHWVSSSGTTPGYTIVKARQLFAAIQANVDSSGKSAWDYLQITLNPNPLADPLADPAILLCHYMIEKAGDVVIKRRDPAIGLKMALAATLRTDDLKDLMSDTIGTCPNVDAAWVQQAEATYREQTLTLGLTYLQSEEKVMDALTTRLTDLVQAYLEAAGGHALDPQLLPIISQVITVGLKTSLTLVQGDYMAEIGSVISSLEQRMAANGIAY